MRENQRTTDKSFPRTRRANTESLAPEGPSRYDHDRGQKLVLTGKSAGWGRQRTRALLFRTIVLRLTAFWLLAISQPSRAQPAAWLSAAPMPVATGRYAFAQNGVDFYILGGATDAATSAAVFHYNAITNSWNQLANVPVASQAPVAAYFGGKIYLVDGYNLL